jgi:hypothetical protein
MTGCTERQHIVSHHTNGGEEALVSFILLGQHRCLRPLQTGHILWRAWIDGEAAQIRVVNLIAVMS